MRALLIIVTLKLVFCTQYYYDVNQLHEPLTELDVASKTIKYCIHMNNRTLDNNYLTGTWYTLFKFAHGLTGSHSDYCQTTNFTRPTKENLDEYKAKYDLTNETFSFDNSALICTTTQGFRSTINAMVVGDKTAKYYFLNPKTSQRLMGMYIVLTYKPVNNDYLIYYDCAMRGHVKYLWSRRRNQTDEELKSVIRPLYELQRSDMGRERYCKKRKVVSTTPYF